MTDPGPDSDAASGDFRFDYRPGTIRYGAGAVADLGAELDRLGVDRAMVVTGTTVGSTAAVMDPVGAGLGDRLVEVFARTTTEKSLTTALDAATRAREVDADALVAVGGGSSLDCATVAAALHGDDRSREAIVADFAGGGLSVAGSPPVVAGVPTTLAGADLSQVAGITADPDVVAGATGDRPDGRVHGGIGDPRLMPDLVCYGPDLFATTPRGVLAASAMNGFDKAVEAPYARTATPVTDATARRALSVLSRSLGDLTADDRDPDALAEAVVGTVLAQYGASRPDGSTLSLIHAFGHALSRPTDLQQGAAHGIAAPHVLRYLFDRIDARRDLLAAGLGVHPDPGATEGLAVGDPTATPGSASRSTGLETAADPDAVAAAVVDRVASIRDDLELPARLRSVDSVDRADLPAFARAVVEDGLTPNAPVDPTVEEMAAVLEDAW